MTVPNRVPTTAVLIALSAALGVWLHCTLTQVSGTSDVGNPESVSGTVVDTVGGAGVEGVVVALIPPDFRALGGVPLLKAGTCTAAAADTTVLLDTTDSDGRFQFRSVPAGTYNLVAANTGFVARLYLPEVVVLDSSVDLGEVPLMSVATVVVNLSDSMYQSGGRIVVPGTFIAVPVEAAGPTVVDVVGGVLRIVYVSTDR